MHTAALPPDARALCEAYYALPLLAECQGLVYLIFYYLQVRVGFLPAFGVYAVALSFHCDPDVDRPKRNN